MNTTSDRSHLAAMPITNLAEARAFIDAVTEPEAEIAQNVQIDIMDLDTDDAAPLAADVARQAMIDVGMPVGPTTPVQLTSFDGSYLVDLPAEWYNELVESGEDYWAETGNVAVTISIP
jgi:hypothetical protein